MTGGDLAALMMSAASTATARCGRDSFSRAGVIEPGFER
jgi:hypothetical protein